MECLASKLCSKCNIAKSVSEFYAHKRHSSNCKSCVGLRNAAWKLANKAFVVSSRHQYKERNRVAINAKAMQQYYADSSIQQKRSAKWRAKNKEQIARYNAAWDRANLERLAAKSAARRAIRLKAVPKWADMLSILKIYEDAKILTATTGIKWSVDHIVPLRSKVVCGLHVERNLALLPLSANCTKGNKRWPDMPEAVCR